MGFNLKVRYIPIVFLAVLTSSAFGADAPPKPVKVTAAQAAGPIFSRKDAVNSTGVDGPSTDVALMQSADKKFTTGVYKAGPSDLQVDGDGYPEDEFFYLLTGGVTLTSTDGSVLDVRPGESVSLPKGWKGRWTTQGYTKYYVTYNAEPGKN